MTAIHKTKAILYYDKDTEELEGRKLFKQEYDDMSLWALQTAIGHSTAGLCLFDSDDDLRFTREFYDLSVDELKQALKEQHAIIVRNLEPEWRNQFPPITRGPRRGLPYFKEEPEEHKDRMYSVVYEDEVITHQGEIEFHDGDDTFTVVQSQMLSIK